MTRGKVVNDFTWPLPAQLLSARCCDGVTSRQNSRNTFHLESTQLLLGPCPLPARRRDRVSFWKPRSGQGLLREPGSTVGLKCRSSEPGGEQGEARGVQGLARGLGEARGGGEPEHKRSLSVSLSNTRVLSRPHHPLSACTPEPLGLLMLFPCQECPRSTW